MTMSRYERVLTVLNDGEWHDEYELNQLTAYLRDWIRELEREGKQVDQFEREGHTWVRLKAA
jgi:hypothetical protein